MEIYTYSIRYTLRMAKEPYVVQYNFRIHLFLLLAIAYFSAFSSLLHTKSTTIEYAYKSMIYSRAIRKDSNTTSLLLIRKDINTISLLLHSIHYLTS